MLLFEFVWLVKFIDLGNIFSLVYLNIATKVLLKFVLIHAGNFFKAYIIIEGSTSIFADFPTLLCNIECCGGIGKIPTRILQEFKQGPYFGKK